jgi:F0F1-type ATP synthase assembly protein I
MASKLRRRLGSPGSTALVDDEPKGSDGRREMMRASGQFMGLGLTWALAVLLFLGIGAWVDSKLGTSPILMILGAFVGGAAGFYSLYHHIVIEPRERSDDPPR